LLQQDKVISVHVSISLTDEVRRVLLIFRALLILSAIQEEVFARPFSSFIGLRSDVIIEFDASLFGGGIFWLNEAGVCLGALSVDLTCLGFGDDSSYQNTCEFITAVLGVIGAVRLCRRSQHPVSVSFKGDSVAALTWLEQGRFKSSNVVNASLMYILICFWCCISVSGCVHIAAEHNTSADHISRGGLITDLADTDIRIKNASYLSIPGIEIFLTLCDPKLDVFTSDQVFIRHWGMIRGCIASMLA
jgi:hypothetical protein